MNTAQAIGRVRCSQPRTVHECIGYIRALQRRRGVRVPATALVTERERRTIQAATLMHAAKDFRDVVDGPGPVPSVIEWLRARAFRIA